MASSPLLTTTIKLSFIGNKIDPHKNTSPHKISCSSSSNNTPNLNIKLNRRQMIMVGGTGGLVGSSSCIANANANANELFPATLDKTITTSIRRPKASRSRKEKQDHEELLVIEGIEFDPERVVKFDVLINDDQENHPTIRTRPEHTEFAGSFVNVPRLSMNSEKKKMKTTLRLALTDLLEDLDADGDGEVAVTLVPRQGADVVIGSVKIEFER